MNCISLPAMPVEAGSYFENHIVLERTDGGISTRGSYERWDAYLRGEYVGKIEFFEKPHSSWISRIVLRPLRAGMPVTSAAMTRWLRRNGRCTKQL